MLSLEREDTWKLSFERGGAEKPRRPGSPHSGRANR